MVAIFSISFGCGKRAEPVVSNYDIRVIVKDHYV